MEFIALNWEWKIFFYSIWIILFCFLGGLPILLNKEESESKHYLSLNFLLSGIILFIFTLLAIISFYFFNKQYFLELIWLGYFFTTLFSWIHWLYYRKKINSVTYFRLFISDIITSIIILIPVILLFIWYFN